MKAETMQTHDKNPQITPPLQDILPPGQTANWPTTCSPQGSCISLPRSMARPMSRPLKNMAAGLGVLFAAFSGAVLGYLAAGWPLLDAVYMVIITVFSGAVRRKSGSSIHNPPLETKLEAEDTLIVMCHQGVIPEFTQHFSAQREIRYRGGVSR